MVRLNGAKEKSRNMFNFSKSDADLRNKNDVQYKILCDWLRSNHAICARLEKQSKVIQLDIAKLYDLLLKDDSPPEDMEIQDDNNDTGRSVS